MGAPCLSSNHGKLLSVAQLDNFVDLLKHMKMFHYSNEIPGCVFMHSAPFWSKLPLVSKPDENDGECQCVVPLSSVSQGQKVPFINDPTNDTDQIPNYDIIACSKIEHFVKEYNARYTTLWDEFERNPANLPYLASLGGPSNIGPANVFYGWWAPPANRVTSIYKNAFEDIECSCGGHIPNIFGCFVVEATNCGKLNIDTRYTGDCQAFAYVGPPLKQDSTGEWRVAKCDPETVKIIEEATFTKILEGYRDKNAKSLVVAIIQQENVYAAVNLVRYGFTQEVYFVKSSPPRYDESQRTEYAALGVTVLEAAKDDSGKYKCRVSDNPTIGATCGDHFQVLKDLWQDIDLLKPKIFKKADKDNTIVLTYVSSSLCTDESGHSCAVVNDCDLNAAKYQFTSTQNSKPALVLSDVEGYYTIPFGMYNTLYDQIKKLFWPAAAPAPAGPAAAPAPAVHTRELVAAAAAEWAEHHIEKIFTGDAIDWGNELDDVISELMSWTTKSDGHVVLLGNRDINKTRLLYEMKNPCARSPFGEKIWNKYYNFLKASCEGWKSLDGSANLHAVAMSQAKRMHEFFGACLSLIDDSNFMQRMDTDTRKHLLGWGESGVPTVETIVQDIKKYERIYGELTYAENGIRLNVGRGWSQV